MRSCGLCKYLYRMKSSYWAVLTTLDKSEGIFWCMTFVSFYELLAYIQELWWAFSLRKSVVRSHFSPYKPCKCRKTLQMSHTPRNPLTFIQCRLNWPNNTYRMILLSLNSIACFKQIFAIKNVCLVLDCCFWQLSIMSYFLLFLSSFSSFIHQPISYNSQYTF